VDLQLFRGPLDLLLYLVRKHEVDILEIPIAPITQQFLEYLAVLEQLDVNGVGQFLEMASTLLEIKSRMVRSEEHTSELQSPCNLHSFPTRRSSDLSIFSYFAGRSICCFTWCANTR